MSAPLRLVAIPREPHPYQESLYRELRALGVDVRYAGSLTPSNMLNLLLLPFELAWLRIRGASVLHIHWVFGFQLPGSGRFEALRRVAQLWFGCVLAVAGRLGMRVVWTAHNVLPHGRVFHDDVAARRTLIAASDLVIAHSQTALEELDRRIGTPPRRTARVQLGPSGPFADLDAAALRPPGSGAGPRRFVFLGRVSEYKGIEELLLAMREVAASADVRVVVAGMCGDPAYAARLRELAAPLGNRAELRLEQVPDDEVSDLIASADVFVLPYRRVTTSSSVFDGMAHGRPVVVPDLPAFDDIPADVVIRYDGSLEGLTATLRELAACDAERLSGIGRAAGDYAASFTWSETAAQTLAALETLEAAA